MVWGKGTLVAAGLAVVLAACGSGPLAPGSSVSTITWLASPITQGQNDPRQSLIDAFESAHPNIRVNLISGPPSTDALRDTLEAAMRAGRDVPDVYLGDVIWPAEFGHDGFAVPLSRHLPPDFWSRFPQSLVRGATYRGQTYAAPFFTDQGLLYYRKDLLAQAHLAVPTTWEQLVNEATALQSSGRVKYGFVWQGAAYEGLTCVWTELMTDAGGSALNSAGTRSAIDSAPSLAALSFLRQLVVNRVAPQAVTSFEELQVTRTFDAGESAFARSWPSTYVDARASDLLDRVGVAPLPVFTGGPAPGASTAGGWSLYVNPHTTHLGAALAFITWMTDTEAQDIMASEYHEIPANAAVRFDSSIIASSPVLVAASQMSPVTRPSNTPAYSKVSRAIFANVNAAIAGSRPPAQALADAGRQIDTALAGAGSG